MESQEIPALSLAPSPGMGEPQAPWVTRGGMSNLCGATPDGFPLPPRSVETSPPGSWPGRRPPREQGPPVLWPQELGHRATSLGTGTANLLSRTWVSCPWQAWRAGAVARQVTARRRRRLESLTWDCACSSPGLCPVPAQSRSQAARAVPLIFKGGTDRAGGAGGVIFISRRPGVSSFLL